MKASTRLSLLSAALVAHGTVAAQQATDAAGRHWQRFHVGIAVAPLGSDINLRVSDIGGIPAQIEEDTRAKSSRGRKLVVGFRPLRIFGMELQYLDFGEASDSSGSGGQVPIELIETEGSAEAKVLSALVFIPERAASVDVYAKVGIADLEESVRARGYTALLPGCVPAFPNCAFDAQVDTSESAPYAGFGARFKITRTLGFRVEYEAIDTDSEATPSFFTVGIAAEF